MTISAYSGTAASNTAINGVNVAEGCPPGNINDAIRNLMADIANGPIVTAGGTVSLPGYTFAGDGDTGIASTAANSLSISTGGVTRALWSASGAFSVTGAQTIQSGGASSAPALTVLNTGPNLGRVRVGNNVDLVGGDDVSGWSINYGGATNNGLTWTNAVGLRVQSGSTNGGIIRLGDNCDLRGGNDYSGFALAINSTAVMTLSGAGNMVINGTLTQLSDRRLKTDITPLTGSLAAIEALQGVRYTRISESSQHIGLIAQDVEAVRPEYVHTSADGFKSVAYGNIVTDLIEAVKTLSARVAVLEAG